jgi:hypothetical protein
MLEKYRVADPCRSRFDNVHVETPMMLHRSADAVPNLTVDIPGASVLWVDVCHHQASKRCERAFHVIMLPVHMCICRYFGYHVALTKQIDGEFGGSNEVTPQRKWESVVDTAEDQDEMIFERLDRALGHVSAVAVGRY